MILTLFIFILLSYILPAVYYIFFLLSIYLFIVCICKERRRKVRRVLYIAGFLIILRIAGFLTGYYIVNYFDPPPRNIYEVYDRMGILAFAAGIDGCLYELILMDRIEDVQKTVDNISKNKTILNTMDLESKKSGFVLGFPDSYDADNDLKWKKKSSKLYIYSIGPDQIDTNANVIYDPTNGVGTPGDIVAIRELTKIK